MNCCSLHILNERIYYFPPRIAFSIGYTNESFILFDLNYLIRNVSILYLDYNKVLFY